MSKKTISVVLCTYNGERFLQDQLDSYRQQTRLPDELIVCDDGSQDGTIQLIHNFAKQAPFPVKLYINEKNMGFAKNFEHALSLCSGDIVALSDQDDIWLENRLDRFEQIFLNDPTVGYVFCDGLVVNDKLQSLDYTILDVYQVFKRQQLKYQPFEFTKILLGKRGTIQGCLLVLRPEVIKIALPIPDMWGHDGWLCFAGSLSHSVAMIPEILMKYRIHSNNTGPLIKNSRTSRLGYLKVAKKWEKAWVRIMEDDRYLKYRNELGPIIKAKIYHMIARGDMPQNFIRRLPKIIKEIISFRYFKYSRGLKSIAKDILFLD